MKKLTAIFVCVFALAALYGCRAASGGEVFEWTDEMIEQMAEQYLNMDIDEMVEMNRSYGVSMDEATIESMRELQKRARDGTLAEYLRGGSAEEESGATPGQEEDEGNFTPILREDSSYDGELMYAFIDGVVEVLETALESDKIGMDVVTSHYYGTAAASISAMRYAVDCLLEIRGAAPGDDGRPDDWDVIAALGWASPYPYLFEGIVLTAKGNSGAARSRFEKAALNPVLGEDDADLLVIIEMNIEQLQSLRSALTEVEDRIFEVYTGFFRTVPRGEFNFSAAYLRSEGRKVLEADESAYYEALDYYFAALAADPFDVGTYLGIVMIYTSMEDMDGMRRWLNTGMLVDPENEKLNKVYDMMKGALR